MNLRFQFVNINELYLRTQALVELNTHLMTVEIALELVDQMINKLIPGHDNSRFVKVQEDDIVNAKDTTQQIRSILRGADRRDVFIFYKTLRMCVECNDSWISDEAMGSTSRG